MLIRIVLYNLYLYGIVAAAAQWNGAVPCSSAAAAPRASATLSDLLSADAKLIYDNGCCVDFSKKGTAISVTGENNCT